MQSKALYLWAFLVFLSSELLARCLGIRFARETLDILYQYPPTPCSRAT